MKRLMAITGLSILTAACGGSSGGACTPAEVTTPSKAAECLAGTWSANDSQYTVTISQEGIVTRDGIENRIAMSALLEFEVMEDSPGQPMARLAGLSRSFGEWCGYSLVATNTLKEECGGEELELMRQE